jgi:hypothetical protein
LHIRQHSRLDCLMPTWLHAQNGIRNDQLRIRNLLFRGSNNGAGKFEELFAIFNH